jgi:hypothetical protein
MVDEAHQQGYNYVLGGWDKKSKAVTFADFLAPEIGINRRGLIVDKDGSTQRIHIPLLGKYWDPKHRDWGVYVAALKEEIRKWASS